MHYLNGQPRSDVTTTVSKTLCVTGYMPQVVYFLSLVLLDKVVVVVVAPFYEYIDKL